MGVSVGVEDQKFLLLQLDSTGSCELATLGAVNSTWVLRVVCVVLHLWAMSLAPVFVLWGRIFCVAQDSLKFVVFFGLPSAGSHYHSQFKCIVVYTCLTWVFLSLHQHLLVSPTPYPPFFSASKFGCFRSITQLAHLQVLHAGSPWIQAALDWKYSEGKKCQKVPRSELRFTACWAFYLAGVRAVVCRHIAGASLQ